MENAEKTTFNAAPGINRTSDEPPLLGATKRQEELSQTTIPDALPILPLRKFVVFPGTIVPLTVNRAASRKMLEESLPNSKVVGIFTQRDPENVEPGPADLHKVGVAGVVLKMLRRGEDGVMVVVQALRRVQVRQFHQTTPYLRAEVEVLGTSAPPETDQQFVALLGSVRETARKLVASSPEVPREAEALISSIEDPGLLADFLASNLNLSTTEKQDLLEQTDVEKRMRAVQARLAAQYEISQLQQKIQQDVASQFTDAQRRAYLREQIRAIQRELGEEGPGPDEQVELLRRRLADKNPPKAVIEHADRELKRLLVMPAASPEHSVIVSYVETLSELPWSDLSPDNLDLEQAKKILDQDHYDLEKVKRRLIEYLAVRKLNPQGHGPILCLLGPPGVGKTSLGQSIADALGRKFSRLSLGGIRDEAEIRGHRRTYIGSMPGRIIQELRRTGTRNPVIMLDEIDKLGADFRGDPASALLEVLDPRQNNAFVDHYIDVAFDLSQVIFIATANYLDPVPPALRDRMEIVEIPGYTGSDKLQIAKRYLVPRQLAENGLKPEQCEFEDAALVRIIEDYTHEAGVRDLERQVGAIFRFVAARVASGDTGRTVIDNELVRTVLGPPRYVREERLRTSRPGVVTGLAFTPTGGEVLFIEATKYPGKGTLTLTGHIGQVMKESVQAALSLVRARVSQLGIDTGAFKDVDIHVHVPSGAVPKDGPSAGIAMFTALASLFTDEPVRHDVAMTGEVTLRGLVLPIGGLKEKSLAAMRAGIRRVIIPKANEKDLPEIPAEVKSKVEFIPVEEVEEVLGAALEHPQRVPLRGTHPKHSADEAETRDADVSFSAAPKR
jgi:ATP-dependent Lon protease